MIKVVELKIGNLVEYDLTKMDEGTDLEPFKVETISADGIITISDDFNNVYIEEDLNGINLSPEILEKCGFEGGGYHENHYYKNELGGHIVWYSGDKTFTLEAVDDVQISNHLQYVHQLQNLYYALTGQELTIKL